MNDDQEKGRIQQYPLKENFRLPFPLAASFSFHKYNTEGKERNSGHEEGDSQRHIQFFKEITGETNCQDCFAEVAKIFGDKFLRLVFKNDFHYSFLSFDRPEDRSSVDEGAWGKTGGWDGDYKLMLARRGKRDVWRNYSQ